MSSPWDIHNKGDRECLGNGMSPWRDGAPRSADFQYFQSAVSRISNPQALGSSGACRLAAVAPKRRFGAPRRRKVGDTAGWETCATRNAFKGQMAHALP